MFLIVIKGTNIGSTFPLNKRGPIIIGRGKECDIRVLDLLVSRRHCQIEERQNNFYIKDLISTNKTVVNKRVIEDEERLKIGDLVEIGDTVLLFTDQKEISIKSVQDYDKIRESKTRPFDLPLDQIPSHDTFRINGDEN